MDDMEQLARGDAREVDRLMERMKTLLLGPSFLGETGRTARELADAIDRLYMHAEPNIEYLGSHFIPLRKAKPGEFDWKNLHSMGANQWAKKIKGEYSHDGFYEAVKTQQGGKAYECELFRRVEDGRVYVPGDKTFFDFTDCMKA